MIIDGHAHACGEYLQAKSVIHQLNANQVDKVVLVPGELNSKKTYSLPDLGRLFPKRNTLVAINRISKIAIALSGAAKHIHEGNVSVHKLVSAYPDRIIQFYWVAMRRPNAFIDLQEDYQKYRFKMAIRQLGAKKVIMGTDIPYGKNNLARTLERIRALQISNEEKELILGLNMSKILS